MCFAVSERHNALTCIRNIDHVRPLSPSKSSHILSGAVRVMVPALSVVLALNIMCSPCINARARKPQCCVFSPVASLAGPPSASPCEWIFVWRPSSARSSGPWPYFEYLGPSYQETSKLPTPHHVTFTKKLHTRPFHELRVCTQCQARKIQTCCHNR